MLVRPGLNYYRYTSMHRLVDEAAQSVDDAFFPVTTNQKICAQHLRQLLHYKSFYKIVHKICLVFPRTRKPNPIFKTVFNTGSGMSNHSTQLRFDEFFVQSKFLLKKINFFEIARCENF